ncbi:MAG TPA: hypothetical protein PKK61_03720 [Defluviitaleaceae bacterium]|nr:hypothetical protein [Defluviitaleaceae bacterium]
MKIKIYDSLIIEYCDSNTIPNIDINLINKLEDKLYEKGFVFLNSYKITRKENNQITYKKSFVHKELCTFASINYIYQELTREFLVNKIKTTATLYTFEVITKYLDESKLISIIDFEKHFVDILDKNDIVFPYKDIKSIDQLLNKHFDKIKELSSSKTIDNSMLSKDYITIIDELDKRSLNKMVENKILKYDSNKKFYTYTFFGALKGILKSNKNAIFKNKNNPFAYKIAKEELGKKAPPILVKLNIISIIAMAILLGIFLSNPASTNIQELFCIFTLLLLLVISLILSFILFIYKITK